MILAVLFRASMIGRVADCCPSDRRPRPRAESPPRSNRRQVPDRIRGCGVVPARPRPRYRSCRTSGHGRVVRAEGRSWTSSAVAARAGQRNSLLDFVASHVSSEVPETRQRGRRQRKHHPILATTSCSMLVLRRTSRIDAKRGTMVYESEHSSRFATGFHPLCSVLTT